MWTASRPSCQQRYRWHSWKNATQMTRMQPRCQRYRGGSRRAGGRQERSRSRPGSLRSPRTERPAAHPRSNCRGRWSSCRARLRELRRRRSWRWPSTFGDRLRRPPRQSQTSRAARCTPPARLRGSSASRTAARAKGTPWDASGARPSPLCRRTSTLSLPRARGPSTQCRGSRRLLCCLRAPRVVRPLQGYGAGA